MFKAVYIDKRELKCACVGGSSNVPLGFVSLTENLMTFALGRGVEYYDAPAVRRIVGDATKDDYRFSSLILGIVKSVPFQMRRAEMTPVAGKIGTDNQVSAR